MQRSTRYKRPTAHGKARKVAPAHTPDRWALGAFLGPGSPKGCLTEVGLWGSCCFTTKSESRTGQAALFLCQEEGGNRQHCLACATLLCRFEKEVLGGRLWHPDCQRAAGDISEEIPLQVPDSTLQRQRAKTQQNGGRKQHGW